ERRYRERLPLLPGAVEAVERLAARRPLGLASSSNRPLIDLVLEVTGLDRFFRATVSSEEVPHGKPAPDVFLEAARRLGVAPEHAFCHVETPMGAGAISGYPRFNSPRSLALAITWTGWDACDTASNHTVDFGQAGVDATLQALDRWHVAHTGSARSAAEGRRI